MHGKASEDDLKKLMGEYTTVSATMTGIEAEAFGKIYAMLKPNQQAKAPQAFELMAGMFAGGPGGGRPRRPGPGGQGEAKGGNRCLLVSCWPDYWRRRWCLPRAAAAAVVARTAAAATWGASSASAPARRSTA